MKKIYLLSALLYLSFQLVAEENIHTIVYYDHHVFTLESPSNATYINKKKFTRVNSNAPEKYIYLQYSKGVKIKEVKVIVYDKSGEEVATFKEKDFIDQKYDDQVSIFSDERFKYLDISRNDYPYTIEYEYKYEINGIYSIYDWYIQPFNTKTIESTYTCKVPKDYKLNYKALNIDIEPSLSIDAKYDVYRWEIKNPEIIEREPKMPINELVLPMVMISPSKFEIEGYQGDMSTWNSFGKFLYELNKDRDQVSEEFKKEILAMTSACTTDMEKIRVLYKYMQGQCRYVGVQIGIGGWQTFPSSYVEQYKYGDCKALTNYMKSMLKAVGIESDLAVISAGSNPSYVDQNMARARFNHAILYVPSEDIFIECTDNTFPAGYLGSFTQDRFALICDEKGGYLKMTPTYNFEFNVSETTTHIFYDQNGNATVEEQQTIHGIEHDLYRSSQTEVNEKELKDYIMGKYNSPPRSFDDFKMSFATNEPIAQIEKKFTFNRIASKAGNRMFIDLKPLREPKYTPEEDEDRVYPYQTTYGFTHIDTIHYHFPERYEVENISLEPTSIEAPYGSFSVEVMKGDKQLSVVRKMVMKKATILPMAYHKYTDFFKDIRKLDNNKLILVNLRP